MTTYKCQLPHHNIQHRFHLFDSIPSQKPNSTLAVINCFKYLIKSSDNSEQNKYFQQLIGHFQFTFSVVTQSLKSEKKKSFSLFFCYKTLIKKILFLSLRRKKRKFLLFLCFLFLRIEKVFFPPAARNEKNHKLFCHCVAICTKNLSFFHVLAAVSRFSFSSKKRRKKNLIQIASCDKSKSRKVGAFHVKLNI